MTFRKTIFWIHLLCGIIAGISIFIMCFTGTVLAFEKQIVSYAERDVRQVAPPADSSRLPIETLQANVRATFPDAKPTAIAISADPADAVAFQLGRSSAIYANPYTGEVRAPATTRTHDFMHWIEDWHRRLAFTGDGRDVGKSINGVCNIAFLILAITGLYIWWPRKWRSKGLKRSLRFIHTGNSKARDWNWHNVIGFWSSPVLIVLTLTAMPISYRWASNLIYTAVGETPPVRSGPPGSAAPDIELPAVSVDAPQLGLDTLIASAQKSIPDWSQISLRLPSTDSARTPQPVGITVRSAHPWPRTASTTLVINAFTAEVLQTETFADLSTGRRLRTWNRFLHTGEALGLIGQLVAGVASLGGCILVYTGFALTWRRLVRWRQTRAT